MVLVWNTDVTADAVGDSVVVAAIEFIFGDVDDLADASEAVVVVVVAAAVADTAGTDRPSFRVVFEGAPSGAPFLYARRKPASRFPTGSFPVEERLTRRMSLE